ncbi:S-layer homology domain-containing protein, partial [bacterium]|nr:S-layer homology domain-containing protein [bacterium]
MKKLVLVLVLVFVFALPVLANPFVDVPLNHWAYDSVQSLAAKGVIVGYPDGTFGGGKTMTRYEFAEATAKALAYVEGMDFASADDVAILEKLAIEFADELASLGVTVADLEAALGANSEAIAVLEGKVATLETFFEPVKITGSFEATYTLPSDTNVATLTDETIFNIAATINEKTTAGVSVTIDDALVGGAVATWDSFFIDYQGDKAQLRVGDVAPATIALGLIYDYDTSEGFDGALMTWNMMDGACSGFTRVDDFYTVNAGFGDFGVTASYDKAASAYVGGADLTYTLDDTTLAVEGAVFYVEELDLEYGVAATLGTKFADLTFALDGHYVTDLFAPTEGGFDADRMGGGVEATFAASEDVSLKVGYDYDQTLATPAVVKTNKVSGELGLTFSDIKATVTAGYNLITFAVPAGLTLVYDKATVKLTSDDVTAAPLAYKAYAEYVGYALAEDITLGLTY